MNSKPLKTLYVKDRKAWRAWLAKHYETETEIWLIYYKKSSGKLRIPYNEAVEEALCYGWIDSTAKRLDDERFIQRFTPRRPQSQLSEANKERITNLIGQKKMTGAGLAAIARNFDPEKYKTDDFTIAADILEAIKQDRVAWENYKKFPESYKRIRVGYLEAQRKHSEEALQRSLQYFIKMTAKNKQIGLVKDISLTDQSSVFRRPRYPMPDFIKQALEKHKLTDAYKERPSYQQNDYIGWITRARQEITRQRRLNQMIEELKRGDVYMKMAWRPKK